MGTGERASTRPLRMPLPPRKSRIVRTTLKHVPYKDKKAFANDLKTIYHADTEEKGYSNMQEVTEKWNSKYPNAMKSWENNWDAIVPIFKFSKEVRKVIYTTNAIESLNSTYKRLNRQRRLQRRNKSCRNAM